MSLKASHYLRSAWVNFKSKKWYISLMICSLAIGMFCFIISSIYIDFEYNRNAHHQNADQVYRVMLNMQEEGRNTYLPNPFASELANRHAEVEAVSLLDGTRKDLYLTVNDEDYITEESGYYADAAFFELFTFPLAFGNPNTALEDAKAIIISDRLAKVLFQNEMPIGKEVKIHNKGVFQVTGVLEKVPSKSLMKPEIIFSRELLYREQPRRKTGSVIFTHVKVTEGTRMEDLEESMFSTFKSLYPDVDRFTGIFTERIDEAYWGTSHYDYSAGAQFSSFFGADKRMINVVGYTTLGIMICAILGFLSLSLGLALKRAKEIGVRKVNGAGRRDIQVQLLSESVVYAYIALLFTVIALEVAGSYFSALFGVPIGISYTNSSLLIQLFAFTTILGLLSGFYPAIVISRLNPVKVLLGFNSQQGSGFFLNRLLLTVQLIATIILLFGTLVQTKQVQKFSNFDFGYNKENLIAFTFERQANHRDHMVSIMDEINSMEGVIEVSGGPFPYTFNGYYDFRYDNGDTLIEDRFALVKVQSNYFSLLDISILEGDDFSNTAANSSDFIINKTLANRMGENPVGQLVNFAGRTGRILGVAEDYTDWGLSQPDADPRVFEVNNAEVHSLLIKHDGQRTSALIDELEGQWRAYESVLNPSITNLSTEVDEMLADVQKSTVFSGFLTAMILVLALMNLVGYAVMYGNSKVRNISIRRILGAETRELFFRLTKPFFTALGLSLIIALPLAYWFMEGYLTDYTVRINLTWTDGLLVSLFMLCSILLVVGFQMLNLSRLNPVETLKDE